MGVTTGVEAQEANAQPRRMAGRLWLLAAGTAGAVVVFCLYLWNAHSMYAAHAQHHIDRIHEQLAIGRSIRVPALIAVRPERFNEGVVVFVLAAALWLGWQCWAHVMVRRLSSKRPRFSPLTGPASWFVPVANLVLPPVVHTELLYGSDADGRESLGRGRVALAAMVVWWGLMITGLVWLVVGYGVQPTPPTLVPAVRFEHDMSAAYAYLTLSGLAGVVSVLLITRRISWNELRVRSRRREQVWMSWPRGTRGAGTGEG